MRSSTVLQTAAAFSAKAFVQLGDNYQFLHRDLREILGPMLGILMVIVVIGAVTANLSREFWRAVLVGYSLSFLFFAGLERQIYDQREFRVFSFFWFIDELDGGLLGGLILVLIVSTIEALRSLR
jgi:hypothetical protein